MNYINGIEYEFVEEKDGWISIYQIHDITRERIPCIQAINMDKALDWCSMRERPRIKLNVL